MTVSFPVVVRGFDLQRRRFSVNAQTRDVSAVGASLEGINHLVHPGKKIEIESGSQSAWYSVEWVGKNGTSRAGCVGVRCLEKKYIWTLPAKNWEPDTYQEAGPPQNTSSAARLEHGERRVYPRRSCRLQVEVSTPGSAANGRGTVTDISLGGCYVEMFAPLPVDTVVDLEIDLEGEPLHLSGRVRSSLTSFGMGVAFTALSPGDFERLRKFAPPDASTLPVPTAPTELHVPGTQGAEIPRDNNDPSFVPVASPAKPNGAQSREAIGTVVEAVVRALLRKGILSREDLVEEFDKVKAARQ